MAELGWQPGTARGWGAKPLRVRRLTLPSPDGTPTWQWLCEPWQDWLYLLTSSRAVPVFALTSRLLSSP